MLNTPRNMTVNSHNFGSVPNINCPRSTFNRSHAYKTTFDAGYLVPIYVDEVVPGDTFSLKISSICRFMSALVRPIIDNVHLDFFFFAVPYRLLWDNFEKFMGAQDDPGDSTDYTIPQMESAATGFVAMDLADYFGLPTTNDQSAQCDVNALPFRAYELIFNTWFRDQNLQDSVGISKGDGPDAIADYPIQKRGKRHDYFTSCLPWPQKGTEVSLPLGTTADVKLRTFTGTDHTDDWMVPEVTAGSVHRQSYGTAADTFTNVLPNGSQHNLFADLSDAAAASVNDFREALALQRMFERDARAGTRYIEIVLSHFGVSSPDHRMQRPEYLGGGKTMVQINTVPSTSWDASFPIGYVSAFGLQQHSGIGFTKSFTEHCILIGLCCAYADLTYQQGIDRLWRRSTRADHYFPALAHLGEMEVLNEEIFFSGVPATDAGVFGYQERWANYRFKKSLVTGMLRSTHPQSLDLWHCSEEFGSLPVLNSTFIEEDPPFDRNVYVPSKPHFVLDAWFDLKCARALPVNSVPGIVGHF